jgi:hypothetical protein
VSIYVRFGCDHALFTDTPNQWCHARIEFAGHSAAIAELERREAGWLCTTLEVDGVLSRVDFCPNHAPLYRGRKK